MKPITRRLPLAAGFTVALAVCLPGRGPPTDADMLVAFPHPKGYVCYRAPSPVTIDGSLTDAAWDAAPWTDAFVDIEGDKKPRPRHRTRVKMLWDDDALYVAAEMEEPHLWATLKEHDSVIFHDNDFEVFIDPDGDCQLYAELEINALNTTWDLLLTKPYRVKGKAINAWEIKGLRTAVHVAGTLNDPDSEDKGWSVEIAIPWLSLNEISETELPPAPGDHIRINFSRVQWEHEIVDGKYRKTGNPEDNWVWSPQGVVDMHRPHRWGFLQFTDGGPQEAATIPTASAALSALFEAQHAYYLANSRWAKDVAELGLPEVSGLTIETTAKSLEMRLTDWAIDQDSKLVQLKASL